VDSVPSGGIEADLKARYEELAAAYLKLAAMKNTLRTRSF
jgi:hypothetical protein